MVQLKLFLAQGLYNNMPNEWKELTDLTAQRVHILSAEGASVGGSDYFIFLWMLALPMHLFCIQNLQGP